MARKDATCDGERTEMLRGSYELLNDVIVLCEKNSWWLDDFMRVFVPLLNAMVDVLNGGVKDGNY